MGLETLRMLLQPDEPHVDLAFVPGCLHAWLVTYVVLQNIAQRPLPASERAAVPRRSSCPVREYAGRRNWWGWRSVKLIEVAQPV